MSKPNIASHVVVGTPSGASKKYKGDLLEGLAVKLLKANNYEVQTEIRNTGAELDLLCNAKANSSKSIYVECKALASHRRIQSDVIVHISGLRAIKGYEEVWLITTTELGKDAKGLVEDIKNGKDARYHTFITPEQLIESLVNASIIRSADVTKKEAESLVTRKGSISEARLLITAFGYFWIYEYKPHGIVCGYIFFDAYSSEVITELTLLNQLAELEQLNRELNFSIILELLDEEKASRLTVAKIKLSETYTAYLDVMKFRINHSGKDELKNGDIFVFPDLENSSDDKRGSIDSQTISFSPSSLKAFIFGDDLSGKTTLLQQYQIAIADTDQIALLINAAEIKVKSLDSFNMLLIEKFKSQYSESSEYIKFFKYILENSPEQVTILIDDLQSVGIKKLDSQYTIMRAITACYPRVVLTAHRSAEVELLARSEWKEIFTSFSQYNILQLGHVKRDQLIEKWLQSSEEEELDDNEIHNTKSDLATKINVAVGKSFMPTHPFYLLTMLQILHSSSNSAIKGTAYGELYGYLITHALSSANAHSDELDFYSTYLSHLAYRLFNDQKDTISLIELEEFYFEYAEKMYIEKNFDRAHKLLVKSRLLVEKNEGYAFQFNYVAYYFVAKYLSDNDTLPDSRKLNDILVKNLYKDKYANVVIFLIHHSKSTRLIDSILDEAKALFEDVEMNMLTSEELLKFNKLLTKQVSLTLSDKEPLQHRSEELKIKDEIGKNDRESVDEAITDQLDLFGKIRYSFRIMEVLGQIANNYYGSLDGPKKAEIIHVLYELSLRSMNALLMEYEQYIDGIKEEVRQSIAKHQGKNTDVDMLTNKAVYNFTQLIVFAFIKKASDSVMSKKLFPTIERIPIGEKHYAKHLITTAIMLNFPDGMNHSKNSIITLFDELDKNFLSKDVLRVLVLGHFYKFYVPHVLKHSVCNSLQIKIPQPVRRLA